jgi:hypothetical protein
MRQLATPLGSSLASCLTHAFAAPAEDRIEESNRRTHIQSGPKNLGPVRFERSAWFTKTSEPLLFGRGDVRMKPPPVILVHLGAAVFFGGCVLSIATPATAPTDTIACVCPGLPGRFGSPCPTSLEMGDFKIPVDGAVTIRLNAACQSADAVFTHPMGGAACHAVISSGDPAVLQFVPHIVPVAVGSGVAVFETGAVNPSSLNPVPSEFVTFTVFDANSGQLRQSGVVLVSSFCPGRD